MQELALALPDAPSEEEEEEDIIDTGSRVVVLGLAKAAEYNGTTGTVRSYNLVTCRFTVELDDSGTLLVVLRSWGKTMRDAVRNKGR